MDTDAIDRAVAALEERLTRMVKEECDALRERLQRDAAEAPVNESQFSLEGVAAGEYDAAEECGQEAEREGSNGSALAAGTKLHVTLPAEERVQYVPQVILGDEEAGSEDGGAAVEAAEAADHVSPTRARSLGRSCTFPELVLQRAPQWGKRTALVDDANGGRVITYRSLMADIRIVGAALSACGCTSGTRVALLMGSEAAFVPTVFAVLLHGALAVLCGTDTGAAILERQLAGAGARVVLTSAQHADAAAAALAGALQRAPAEGRDVQPAGTVVVVDCVAGGDGRPTTALGPAAAAQRAPRSGTARPRGGGGAASPQARRPASIAAVAAGAPQGRGAQTTVRGVRLQVTCLSSCLTPKELARCRRSPAARHGAAVAVHLGLHPLPRSARLDATPAVMAFPTRRCVPGLPARAVVHTHGTLRTALAALTSPRNAAEGCLLPRDTVAGGLSLATAEGFMLQLCAPLRVGAAVVCSPGLRPERLHSLLHQREVSVLVAPPPLAGQLADGALAGAVGAGEGGDAMDGTGGDPAAGAAAGAGLRAHPRVGRAVSKLRQVWCVGEPLARRAASHIRRNLGTAVSVLNAYVTAETLGATHTAVPSGRARLHGALEDCGVLRAGAAERVEPAAATCAYWRALAPAGCNVGRLFVRMGGWAQSPPQWVGADGLWRPCTGGGEWLDTGDIALIGPDGRVCVLGRAEDALGAGGDGPCPAEVEAKWPLVVGVPAAAALPGAPLRPSGSDAAAVAAAAAAVATATASGRGPVADAAAAAAAEPPGCALSPVLCVAAERTHGARVTAEDVLVRVGGADERVAEAACVSALPRCAQGRVLRWHLRLAMLDHRLRAGSAPAVEVLAASAGARTWRDARGEELAAVGVADAAGALRSAGIHLAEGDAELLARLAGAGGERGGGVILLDRLRALAARDLAGGVAVEEAENLLGSRPGAPPARRRE